MASQASGDGNGAGPGVVSSVMNEIRGFRDKLKVESESEGKHSRANMHACHQTSRTATSPQAV